MIWVLNLGGAKYNFLLKKVHIGFGAHQAFYSMDTGGLPRTQRPDLKVNQSSPHGFEVKNEWSCISTHLHAFKVWTETTLNLYKTPPNIILKEGNNDIYKM